VKLITDLHDVRSDNGNFDAVRNNEDVVGACGIVRMLSVVKSISTRYSGGKK
jgi:hypothetical protein